MTDPSSPSHSADRLQITHECPRPGVAVVRPAGEMDASGAPAVAELVGELARTCRRVVLDMRLVTFVDARGIHALVEGDQEARRVGARQIVVGVGPAVLRILQICRVDQELTLADLPHDDPAQAADLPLDVLEHRRPNTEAPPVQADS